MSKNKRTITRHSPTLLLASASPQRRALLASLGLPFETRSLDADEQFSEQWSPESVARTLAGRKLESVHDSSEWDYVITADTIVCAPCEDGEKILGKPENEEQAMVYLALLSGTAHRVITGVSLSGRAVDTVETEISQTIVHVAQLSKSEVAWYVSLEEWREIGRASCRERVYSMLRKHRYPFR